MGSPESLVSVKSGAGSPAARRAIGIVRVSEVGGRSGESFASPVEQRERIAAACERDGFELLEVIEEMDVSGGTPLGNRAGLRRAVEAVEAEEAEVIVAAYFDRLVRSLTVQAEVVRRVEEAGGAILAVDVGRVTNGSAGQWLSGTMLGAVSEYHRRVSGERTEDSKRRAHARGVPTFPNIPPGLRKREDGTLEHDPVTGPVAREAFRLRAAGATVEAVRKHLAAHGIKRAFHGVQAMLSNRLYRGELHYGDFPPNLEACEPLIDADTFNRVQAMKLTRGRRPKSDFLLARLGVLRCGTCGARMTAGSTVQHGKRYGFYRCPTVGDCPQRVTIGAEKAEAVIVGAVQEALAGVEGAASIGEGVETAERALGSAQEALDAAIRAFTGLTDEPAARDRLQELRGERDAAREHLDRLDSAHRPAVTVSAAGDWNLLNLGERRALIAAVVDTATVAPGKGTGRVTVELRGE